MKKIISIACLLTIYCYNSIAQDTIYCKPEIKQVTIFTNDNGSYNDFPYSENPGSQLDMETVVNLKPGLNTILFNNLPKFEKFQLFYENDCELISSNSRKKMQLTDEKQKTKKILELETKLEEINKAIDRSGSFISIYTSEREMILSNKTVVGNTQSGLVEEIRKLGDYYRQRIEEIDSKLYDVNKKHESNIIEQAFIKQQIKDLKEEEGIVEFEIVALVSSPIATKSKFTLSIYEPTASWYATYDLKVKDISSAVELHYKALIKQETGIDWKNVKVTLSSAQPNISANCPDIKKWNLDYFSETKETTILVEDVENTSGPLERKIAEEAFGESITSFNYLLPQMMNIPNAPEPFEIEIITYQIPAMYEYKCVPKLDPGVFLTAKITDWEKYNLISGEANLYLNGVYVGNSDINSGRVEDTLSFSLGSDKQILVERNRITEYSKKTFLSGKRKENIGWEIIIRNNKKSDIDIIVYDQLPVSVRKEIQVEQEDISNGELDEQTGIIQWKIHLKPAESKKLILKYSVSYPKDRKVDIN
jgi:uncharacterized protein (TIGR02231 family)